MEKCQKCSGVMLQMKTKKTVTMLPDAEKKQGWKCSRCGYYLEKQQVFLSNRYDAERNEGDDNYPHLRRR